MYFRAKSFVERENLKYIIGKNELDYNDFREIPMELIETMETIRNYKVQATTLLDVGAHKGLFSKAANSFFKFKNTVCFEPNKEHNGSIKSSNKGSGLRIENIALSNKRGKVTFYLHKDDAMNSIVESENDVLKAEFPWDNPELMKKTTVDTITLDNYISDNSLQKETFFLKIDTQGNELNVLKHGVMTLRQTEICLIEYMFTSPYKSDFVFYDLVSFMNQNNFDCKGALTINKRPSKKISAVDFLFVKK